VTRQYTRHGLHALKTRVETRGLKELDARTAVAKDLIAWRRNLIGDLGGESNVTTAERTLIESATRTKLFLDHIDAFLISQKTLVRRNKGLSPVLKERGRIEAALTKTLVTLGLSRRAASRRTTLEAIRG